MNWNHLAKNWAKLQDLVNTVLQQRGVHKIQGMSALGKKLLPAQE